MIISLKQTNIKKVSDWLILANIVSPAGFLSLSNEDVRVSRMMHDYNVDEDLFSSLFTEVIDVAPAAETDLSLCHCHETPNYLFSLYLMSTFTSGGQK